MKILIDIGHPGHVHLFRPFAEEMQKKGHKVLFTCRQKEFEIELLKAANFDFISFGKHYSTLSGKIFGLLKFNFLLLKHALKFRPDVFMSHGSIYAAHVSFLVRKPHISMEDSGNMEQVRLYKPFTKVILTPHELPEELGIKQIRYKAYHELAYLNPKYFTPRREVLKSIDIEENERFAILRFVSWNATHDVGQGGIGNDQKREIINFLSSKMKLFISAEGDIDKDLQKYLIKIEPSKIHHVLAFADIVVSEGATIASESGVLGTPTVYVNSLKRCYNEDQERYGLVYNFQSGIGVLEKVKELTSITDRSRFQKARNQLLEDKIDLTAFLVWFIENYPESENKVRTESDYQFKFRNE